MKRVTNTHCQQILLRLHHAAALIQKVPYHTSNTGSRRKHVTQHDRRDGHRNAHHIRHLVVQQRQHATRAQWPAQLAQAAQTAAASTATSTAAARRCKRCKQVALCAARRVCGVAAAGRQADGGRTTSLVLMHAAPCTSFDASRHCFHMRLCRTCPGVICATASTAEPCGTRRIRNSGGAYASSGFGPVAARAEAAAAAGLPALACFAYRRAAAATTVAAWPPQLQGAAAQPMLQAAPPCSSCAVVVAAAAAAAAPTRNGIINLMC
jgi:hypothetical protein